MFSFVLIFVPAVLITLFAKFYWHKDICGKEGLISLGLNLLSSLVFCTVFVFYGMSQTSDYYLVTGNVQSKQQQRVSCSHSYQCNCRDVCSGSGDSRTCTRVCDTCYEHSHDYDWVVRTSVGNLTIDRVNRRGDRMPPRFREVKIGEPATLQRSFRNYLLADSDSLFVYNVEHRHSVANYPRVYDYYRINRVIGTPPNTSREKLNNHLNEYLVNKRYNVIVVFTREDENYFYSVAANWVGGKKNDIIMVYGIDGDEVKWFRSTSYGMGIDNRLLHDKLLIMSRGKTFDLSLVDEQLQLINGEFRQTSTEQFEHLKYAIEIPWFVYLIVLLLNVGTSVGIATFMRNNKL